MSSSALEVPRSSVGKSSASSVPERDAGHRGREHGDGRHDPDDRAALQEEHHLRDRRDEQCDDRDGLAAALLGEAAADDEPDEAGERGRHGAEQRDARAREVAHVLEVLVHQLRRRRVEDVGEEADRGEQREAAAVHACHQLAQLAARGSRCAPRRALYRVVSVSARAMRGARRSVSVPATYARRQPLSPMSMRQRDDCEREAEAGGEREHRGGVRPRAFGRLLDHRDPGDDERWCSRTRAAAPVRR